MTCKKYFTCDLCNSSIADESGGIGVNHASMGNIKPVYMHDGGHHLCNPCVQGLRLMLAELDRTAKIYQDRALDEEAERAGVDGRVRDRG